MIFDHNPLSYFPLRLRFSRRALMRQISLVLLVAILTQAAAPAFVDAATLETAAEMTADVERAAEEAPAPVRIEPFAPATAPQLALPSDDLWKVKLLPTYDSITVGQVISESWDVTGWTATNASPHYRFYYKKSAPVCAIATVTGTVSLTQKGNSSDELRIEFAYGQTKNFSGTYTCDVLDDGIAKQYSTDLLQQPANVNGSGRADVQSICDEGSTCSYTCQMRFQADYGGVSVVGFKVLYAKGGTGLVGHHQFVTSWIPCEYALSPDRTQAPEKPCLDGAGQAQTGKADPVNTFSGNFTRQETDFSLSTRGLPLAFERSYNAQDTASGALGQGWTHTYAMRLLIESTKVTLVAPHGSRIPFYKDGSAFVPAPGVRAQLTLSGGVYTLEQGDGVTYTFDSSGRLLTLGDGRGNTTTLVYSGDTPVRVVAPDGRALILAYTNGLLTSVSDPLGRSVQYGYTNGRLTAVTDRRGQVWTYAYDGAGRMTSFGDPNGHTVTNVYDSNGRVSAQTNALGQTTTFTYNRRRTTVTDAAGRATVHRYNEQGALLSVTDPMGRVTTYTYDSNYNRTSVTDPLGRTTRFVWDGSGCNYTQVIDPLNHITSFAYDADHNLTAVADPLNRATWFGYDANDNLIAITNTLGYAATFGYNGYGQMTSSADPLGRVTTYGYDEDGNLSSVVDPLGQTTTLTYDLGGRLITATNALTHSTVFAYDAADNLVRVVDALDGETVYDYDAAGNLTSIRDPRLNLTQLGYDAAGELVSVTDALGGQTTLSYDIADGDAQRRVAAVTDANGHSTGFGYDLNGRLTSVTDALNGQTGYTYDAVGNLTQITDALGRTTLFHYDALYRTVGVTNALGVGTWYGYDAVGNVVAEWQPGLAVVQYSYDALDRPESVTLPGLGEVLHYSYDAAGNLVTSTDADGRSTTYTYDLLNRLSQTLDPLSHVTGYGYDPLGNLISATDAEGRVTEYLYDALGRMTGVVDPLDGQTTYQYDAAGNLISAADANGHADTYTYDALNRPATTSDPLGHTTAYGYDAVGNTTIISDADGGVTNVAYDPLNRPVQAAYPAMGNFAAFNVQYRYDAVGNRKAMTDTTGTTTYSYDALDRPTAINAPVTGQVHYTYNAAGQRTQTLYPTGETADYTYDTLGRLATVTDWDGQTTAYAYNDDGSLAQTTRPNGIVTTYDYDNAGRLTGIQHQGVTQTLGAYTYTLDNVGNRIAITETLAGVSASAATPTPTPDPTTTPTPDPTVTPDPACECTGGQNCPDLNCDPESIQALKAPLSRFVRTAATSATKTNGYTYDDNGRLTYASYGAGYTYDYDYDAVGNRTSMMVNASNLYTYTYDVADRLIADSTHTEQNRYDNRGNLTYDGDWVYEYDGANRLARATLANVFGVEINYTYNGDGLMVAEDVNGSVTRYTWDQALELPQMLAASNGDRYLYGHDRLGVERANAWSYPLPDAMGTVRQRSDAAGNVSGLAAYDPFGKFLQGEGASDPFGFTGERTTAIGLQYLRARWYDPSSGRFTQVDPFAGVLGAPGTQHPYAYGLNNPLRYADPSGEVVTEAVVLGLVAAAVVYTAGYLVYDALVPDVAQGFTGWHALGYILGYENIRQDIKTMHSSCAKWWQRGLAALDAVWNAALGISLVHGLASGLWHTFSLAKSLLKAGPASHSMLTLGNVTLRESATVVNPFRVPGTTNILVPPGYLGGNKWKVLGSLAHEIAHIQQEFGVLGGILKPLQGVSVATTKGVGLPLSIWGYALNPVEIHAAASGITNWVNLALVTVIKPYIAGVQNGLINDYDFNAQVSIFFKKVFNVKF